MIAAASVERREEERKAISLLCANYLVRAAYSLATAEQEALSRFGLTAGELVVLELVRSIEVAYVSELESRLVGTTREALPTIVRSLIDAGYFEELDSETERSFRLTHEGLGLARIVARAREQFVLDRMGVFEPGQLQCLFNLARLMDDKW